MQIKKFEAPTIQEALDTIKRELGPEAIILQTKKNRKGFGLMNQGSVEVTAAVSERSMQKKKIAERRIPDDTRLAIQDLPAKRQAEVYDKALDREIQRSTRGSDRVASAAAAAAVQESGPSPTRARAPRPAMGRRYVDIEDDEGVAPQRAQRATPVASTQMAVPKMALEDEVRHLKRMMEELKSTQDETVTGSGARSLSEGSFSNPALHDLFEQLVVNGIEKRFALSLVKKAAFELNRAQSEDPDEAVDAVAGELMQTTEVTSILKGMTPRARGALGSDGIKASARIVALIGPTGVGKTTTVAKIASEALLKRGLRVGLINLDGYKVAAFDQLATYAKILNAPFRSASSMEDLKAAIGDFQNLDLVLVDTTGRSQKDPESINDMRELLSVIPSIESQLVLSATTRDVELGDMVSRFSIFRPQSIIISKLDEATTFGAIYNVSQRAKLPLSAFTTGQRVPEDIEDATRERLAALILDL